MARMGRAIMSYFNPVTCGSGAPLSYVLCHDAIPVAGAAYATETEERIAWTPVR
jgi:hypothetical protein